MYRSSPARHHGFTLVESLITLSITSILLSTAVPSFNGFIAAKRISAEVSTLTQHLHLARSEAIKQGSRAVLCPTDNGDECLGSGDWNKGYMVFIDNNANRERDPDEQLIHQHSLKTDLLRVNAGRRKTVSYQISGRAKGSNLTITFCDAHDNAKPRAVVVSMSGRPRTADIHPNGSALTCS
jgi:type IV fimbrial biogenesis protein FimT